MENEQIEKKQLQHKIRQKKIEAENLLTDTIRQLNNRNKKFPQELKIASSRFYITNMADPILHFEGEVFCSNFLLYNYMLNILFKLVIAVGCREANTFSNSAMLSVTHTNPTFDTVEVIKII